MATYDYLIVGAGFAGAVCAERLASAGKRVLLIDQRSHAGGNSHDQYDAHGVLVHPYGPHIFHTNSERVFTYLSRFTEWRPHQHRVLAQWNGNLYPLPVNRTTINSLYGWSLSEPEVAQYLDRVRETRDPIRTSEDVVLALVGRDLCAKFFEGYTRKQWGIGLAELAPSVAARIPVRTGDDDRYFTDRYQFMPAHGFHRLFERMLTNSPVDLALNTSYAEAARNVTRGHTIYTGPIDQFFDYRFGPLEYRSLRFEHIHYAGVERHQPVGTVNYPNDHAYTRVTEFRHLTGQQTPGTSIVREYPVNGGDPFYPVPREVNRVVYEQYQALASQRSDVSFVGRLAQYRYFNMDQAVGAALALASKLVA